VYDYEWVMVTSASNKHIDYFNTIILAGYIPSNYLNLEVIERWQIFNYVYFQANEDEKDHLQIKIQTAIKALNDPLNPMSIWGRKYINLGGSHFGVTSI